MAKAIAHTMKHRAADFAPALHEAARALIVCGCAAALILAGAL